VEKLKAMLHPFPLDQMRAYPVSKDVGTFAITYNGTTYLPIKSIGAAFNIEPIFDK
jgi:hypothetical protein